MTRRLIACLVVCTGVLASPLSAAESVSELDPLLELLVEQGLITREQAEAVQAEDTATPKAEEAPAPDRTETGEEKKAQWYDRIQLKGDVRLRYEGFQQDGIGDSGRRDRFRVRLRPGIYSDITDWMSIGFQVRSGDPADPVSDNQSVDGGFSMKPLAISEGFALFHATDWLDLTGGKFDPKKKWTVSDMQWDDDVTPEGAMEELSFGPLEANFYQYVLEESKSGNDAYLIGGQLLAKLKTGGAGSFKLGVGYDDWVRPQLVADLTLGGKLKGNKVTNLLDENDQLASDFKIVNAFVSWSYSPSERWPIKAYLYGYHNTGAKGLGEDYNKGYFARLQIGDYKERGQLMFRYSRYYSEPDALFYVFAQSDTTRASDVDGHRFDVRVGFVKKSYFNFTFYRTKPVYADVAPMNRWQTDYIIRF